MVKRFKTPIEEDINKVHSREAYCQQMEVQTVASQMAKEFNSELRRLVTSAASLGVTCKVQYNIYCIALKY